MYYAELAALVQKKPATVRVYFSRHGLSIKNPENIRQYLQQVASGKRLERGKRNTSHLRSYQFKKDPSKLARARELVAVRQLAWDTDPHTLSAESVVEHVLAYGDFTDFRELIAILGKPFVRKTFRQQISAARVNYRPQTIHFFSHYFGIRHSL